MDYAIHYKIAIASTCRFSLLTFSLLQLHVHAHVGVVTSTVAYTYIQALYTLGIAYPTDEGGVVTVLRLIRVPQWSAML